MASKYHTKKTKVCKTCLERKSYSQFWNHPMAADGKQYSCVSCCKQKQIMYRHNLDQPPNWRNEIMQRWGRA